MEIICSYCGYLEPQHEERQLESSQPSAPSVSAEGIDALYMLSELIRTVSRVANKFPDALFEHDLDRLTKAKEVLRKNSNNDKTQILNHGEK